MKRSASPPVNPSLENLTKQPKRLQVLWKRWHVDTLARIRASLPQYTGASDEEIWQANARVSQCQLVLAREAGFESWNALKAAVESGAVTVEDPGLPDLFTDRDVDGAKALQRREPELSSHDGYKAHPLLRECVSRNFGHCDNPAHRLIADLVIPARVRSFRDAVLDDRADDVRDQLAADPELVGAEFTIGPRRGMRVAGRGIAQALHYFPSTAVGELLLDAGADMYARTTTPQNETPLSMQCRSGHVEGARLLLERGANPNHPVPAGKPATPTEMAGYEKLTQRNWQIELLLEYGWDVNRGSLLHDANHGWGKSVRMWLDYGADPNWKGTDGRTALHLIAARGTGRDVIQALAAAGADINVRDNEGTTPLDLARKATRTAAARMLIQLGAEDSGAGNV